MIGINEEFDLSAAVLDTNNSVSEVSLGAFHTFNNMTMDEIIVEMDKVSNAVGNTSDLRIFARRNAVINIFNHYSAINSFIKWGDSIDETLVEAVMRQAIYKFIESPVGETMARSLSLDITSRNSYLFNSLNDWVMDQQ